MGFQARVKATSKIVEVIGEGIQNSNMVMTAHGEWFTKDELDIVPLSWKLFEPTYQQKLEHQYVGMFVKSFLDQYDGSVGTEDIINSAIKVAHAIVEKLKEEERK